jgi:predicted RNA-binding protein YlqC (UPF0109 family)/DNA-binding CsgD family transcriptional regulator
LPKKYYDEYEASNRHPSRGDEAMKDLVHNIVEALVDHPDQIEIDEVKGHLTSVIELMVNREDIGKVIGRQGRTAQAIRTTLNAASAKSRKRVLLEVEDLQTALDVLMKKREKDKKIIEERITDNINKLVFPFIKKLKNTVLSANQKELVECLESNLDNIKSSFIENLNQKFLNFTPMEIQVASLVRDGKSNKEIAKLLCLSINTILSHRSRVRQKLGLKNKKVKRRTQIRKSTHLKNHTQFKRNVFYVSFFPGYMYSTG